MIQTFNEFLTYFDHHKNWIQYFIEENINSQLSTFSHPKQMH